MFRNICILVVVCVLGATGLIITKICANSSDVPSAEFLAQALLNQEQSCGQALDITYTLRVVGDPVEAIRKCRYIRTPLILFLEKDSQSYNRRIDLQRNSGESRQLATNKADSKMQGLIDGKFASALGNREFPDVVRFPLDGGTPQDLVRRGKVDATRQDVGGQSCWLVETPGTQIPGEVYRLWLDPAIGFCPRRIEILRSDVTPQTIEFLEYKALGNGVWLPMEIRNKYQSSSPLAKAGENGSSVEVVMRVSRASVDQTIPDSELRVDFPSGTSVSDRITNTKYVKP